MTSDQALDTLSELIDEINVALKKAESKYKHLKHTQNQMFIYNNNLTKLRQESLTRVFITPHTIIYTYNRKLVITCMYLAILFTTYMTMVNYPPALWTFWGFIMISELILKQMI
jgi:hypothetical protein